MKTQVSPEDEGKAFVCHLLNIAEIHCSFKFYRMGATAHYRLHMPQLTSIILYSRVDESLVVIESYTLVNKAVVFLESCTVTYVSVSVVI